MNTQRDTIKLVIKALADTNLDVLIDRLVEMSMKHDYTGFMLDALLKGVVADVEIVDEDKLKDTACRVFDIQPSEYVHANARLCYVHANARPCASYIKLDIKYKCGVDDNGIDSVYDHKQVDLQFEDAETWGINVLYIQSIY